MRIRKMLTPTVLALSAALTGGAQAAPKEVQKPAPFWSGKVTIAATTIKVAPSTVPRGNSKRLIPSREIGPDRVRRPSESRVSVFGTPKSPARVQAPSFQLLAQWMLMSGAYSVLDFGGGSGGPKAKLKFTLVPRSGKSPIQVEAECFVGTVTKGKITLEDSVSGFYQDASGRHELKGDIVTLSAFDNAVSIVQDGEIALSTSASAP